MRLHDEAIGDLLDRVAALDDAPDRTRHHWFYADLARLAADLCDDIAAHPDASHDHRATRGTRPVADGTQRRGRAHHFREGVTSNGPAGSVRGGVAQ